MSRTFADLHLCANPSDAQRLIAKAADLGYSQISIPFNESSSLSELADLKNYALIHGLDLVSRVDYKPRTQEDLTRFLRRCRRRFEVICILCDNKDVARQAAKDHRVDILNFPNLDYRKRFFDYAEGELASNTEVAFEIDVKPLIVIKGPARTRLLTSLRRETAIAKQFHIPVILSSGVGEETLMRKPHDLASLGFLFGFQEEQALNAVSINVSAIIERNRKKLSSKFVSPGITVIEEGDP